MHMTFIGPAPASATAPGYLTTGAQDIAGVKMFAALPIFKHAGGIVIQGLALGDGSSAAWSWNATAFGAPAYTGADGSTRSAGTRNVFYKLNSDTATDYAMGMESGYVWVSTPTPNTAGNGFRLYGGPTVAFQAEANGRLTSIGAHVWKVRVATTTPVTVDAGTDYKVVTRLAAPGAVAVGLPAGIAGQTFVIQDGTGDAAANNITITPASGNINGAATYVINANYGAVVLEHDGTTWLAR